MFDSGVGDGEVWMVEGDVSEEKDIEIDEAGGIGDFGGGAANLPFDFLGGLEEFQGISARPVEFDYGVEEAWGAGGAIFGCGVMEACLEKRFVEGGYGAEEGDCLGDVGVAVAKI